MQPVSLKKKYKIDEYRSEERANPIIQTFTQQNLIGNCICKNITVEGQSCFICKKFIHNCIAAKPNRTNGYECESCLNKTLDPLFSVKRVLNETYFRTHSIFAYINTVNFEFTLNHEDLGYLVEVRGIIPGNTILSWPMQGGFSINDEKNNFHELKPLIVNSNRKSRRQEYFSIPADKLVLGKNYLRFKIPCLNKIKFTSTYQCQEKKLYFFAVNLVAKLSPAELQTQTFRQRRTQKIQSLSILQMNNSDVEITSNKVCLICPYTRDRIKVPIRGKYCKHFSCICLQTLISIHSNSRYWSCPLCDQRINEPYVDVWIYNMLIDNNKGSDVLVKEDGTYEWIRNEEDNMVNLDSEESSESPPYKKNTQKMEIQPLPQKQKEKVETIIDIEDDNVLEVSKNTQKIREQLNVSKLKDQKQLQCKKEPVVNQYMIQSQKNDEDNLMKRKIMFSKMKQKINSKLSLTSQIIQTNNSNDLKKGELNASSEDKVSKMNRSSTDVIKRAENKQQFSLKANEEKGKEKAVIYDIKVLQARQMKMEQFRKTFSKTKVVNKYKKYINNQQMRKLFKEIL